MGCVPGHLRRTVRKKLRGALTRSLWAYSWVHQACPQAPCRHPVARHSAQTTLFPRQTSQRAGLRTGRHPKLRRREPQGSQRAPSLLPQTHSRRYGLVKFWVVLLHLIGPTAHGGRFATFFGCRKDPRTIFGCTGRP
jgi:hypothetical protein